MDPDTAAAQSRPTLSVVVPTYREAANIAVLFERMTTALEGLTWEMIVVDDDSPDGTSDLAFAIAASDPRLRCLRRVNRTGLAGAVIEGWMSSSADFVAVIDGDLQHDESILPKMYGPLEAGRVDLVIGTRMATGRASVCRAQKLSDLGKWFFRSDRRGGGHGSHERLFHDPPRPRLELAPRLSPDGFKILVDVILSAGGGPEDHRNAIQVPQAGSGRIEAHSSCWPRLSRPGRPSCDRWPLAEPLRPIRPDRRDRPRRPHRDFVDVSGLVRDLDFQSGQIAATLVAMGSNFVLNNEITYRTHRYRGPVMIGGFVAFALGCSVGALANINVASFLYRSNQVWWPAALAGALLSVVWNYAVSTNLIWRPRRRRFLRMLFSADFTMIAEAREAITEIFSPPFRRVMWKSLALTVAILVFAGVGLDRLALTLVHVGPAWLSTVLSGRRRARPPRRFDLLRTSDSGTGRELLSRRRVSDGRAENRPERTARAPAPLASSIAMGIRFAALSVLVNVVVLALTVFTGVGLLSFFILNGYLLGREFFELAAMRHVTGAEARFLFHRNLPMVLFAGAIISVFVAAPVLNLLTPLFATAFMTRVYKRIRSIEARVDG